jgi:hypothetical protein
MPRSFNSYKRQQRQQQLQRVATAAGDEHDAEDAQQTYELVAEQQQQQQQPLGAAVYEFQASEGDDNAAAAVSEAVVLRWPVLVVAPTSVLDNWVLEFSKWGLFKVGTSGLKYMESLVEVICISGARV